MLRRKPTSITLTTEDVTAYEDARAREQQQREQEKYEAQHGVSAGTNQQRHRGNGTLDPNQNHNPHVRDPSDELKPLPGDRLRAQYVKSREERLGLGISGGGSGAGGSRG